MKESTFCVNQFPCSIYLKLQQQWEKKKTQKIMLEIEFKILCVCTRCKKCGNFWKTVNSSQNKFGKCHKSLKTQKKTNHTFIYHRVYIMYNTNFDRFIIKEL